MRSPFTPDPPRQPASRASFSGSVRVSPRVTHPSASRPAECVLGLGATFEGERVTALAASVANLQFPCTSHKVVITATFRCWSSSQARVESDTFPLAELEASLKTPSCCFYWSDSISCLIDPGAGAPRKPIVETDIQFYHVPSHGNASKNRLIEDTEDWHPRTGTSQSRSFRILAQITGTGSEQPEGQESEAAKKTK
ncbi:hypothetical protein JZ751_001680 [Albula glossodonta]|uniref:Uncharacterized protein n=1 Tax=Albula glossodonta TaxID=121402 RepID=A0A8T2PU51_9TELE|nr:hypothetical protein JZ751_001680 [Albula glossodonta]